MTIYFDDQSINESYYTFSPNYGEAGFFEEMGAAAEESWLRTPGVSIKNWLKMQDAKTDDSKEYTPDEIKETEWYRKELDYGKGVNESTAQLMAEWYDDRKERENIMAASPGGFWRSTARLGVSLGTQFLDPLNYALAYVPIVGQARYARMAQKIGVFPARAITGFVEGAVGNAMVEPFVYAQSKNEQVDYTYDDMLMSIGLGGVVGGAIHTGAGFIGDVMGLTKSPKDILLEKTLYDRAGGDINKLFEVRNQIDKQEFEKLVDKYGYRRKVREQVMVSNRFSREQTNFFFRILDNIADTAVDSGITGKDGKPITHRDQFYEYWWSGIKETTNEEWFNVKLKEAVARKKKEMEEAGLEGDNLYIQTKGGDYVKVENTEKVIEANKRLRAIENDLEAVQQIQRMMTENKKDVVLEGLNDGISKTKKTLEKHRKNKKLSRSERKKAIRDTESTIQRLESIRKAVESDDVAFINDLATKKREAKDVVVRELEPILEKVEMLPEDIGARTVQKPETNVKGFVDQLFKDVPKIITLFEKGDLSTLIHETGHILSEMIYRNRTNNPYEWSLLAGYVGAPEEIARFNWTVAQKEKLARTFELYLMKGMAPSKELTNVFAKMKVWLLGIYNAVSEAVLARAPNSPFRDVDIDANIKSVFDRWTAEVRDKSAYGDAVRQSYYNDAAGILDEPAAREETTAARVAGRFTPATNTYGFTAPPITEDMTTSLRETGLADLEDLYGPVDEFEMEPPDWYEVEAPKWATSGPDEMIAEPRVQLDSYASYHKGKLDETIRRIDEINRALETESEARIVNRLDEERNVLLDEKAFHENRLAEFRNASERMERGEVVDVDEVVRKPEDIEADETVYQHEWVNEDMPSRESPEFIEAFGDILEFTQGEIVEDVKKLRHALGNKEKEIRRKINYIEKKKDAGELTEEEFGSIMEKYAQEANIFRVNIAAVHKVSAFLINKYNSGEINKYTGIRLTDNQKAELRKTLIDWYKEFVTKQIASPLAGNREAAGWGAGWMDIAEFEVNYVNTLVDSILKDWNSIGRLQDPNRAVVNNLLNIRKKLIQDVVERKLYSRDLAITKEIKKNSIIRRISKYGPENIVNQLQALLVGGNKRLPGQRASVDAAGKALGLGWAGRLLRRLKEDGVYEMAFKHKVDGTKMDKDVIDREIAIELWEDREGGNIGRTGNEQAVKVAKAIHELQDEILERLNMSGARVKKLKGYIVRQTHDIFKLRQQGREKWINYLLENEVLDLNRTFGREMTDQELRGSLGIIYNDIVGGGTFRIERVADLDYGISSMLAAKRSKHRELHFKSAEDWFKYNKAFGSKDLMPAVISALLRAGKDVALLETLGPDPRKAMEELLQWIDTQVTSGNLERKYFEGRHRNSLISQYNELDGSAHIPVDNLIAKVGRGLRWWNNLRALGGATLSAIADTPLYASEMRFQGDNFLMSFGKALLNPIKHLTSKQQKEIAEEVGLGMETMIGNVMSRFTAKDSLSGKMSKWEEIFFKATLLPQWTDAHKVGVATIMANRFGKNATKTLDELDEASQNLLSLYDIGPNEWDAIRQGATEIEGGRMLLTPEGIRNLDDAVFIDYLQAKGMLPANIEDARGLHMQVKGARNDLVNAFRTMLIDRADYAVVTPGARERSFLFGNTQPGTKSGEALRLFAQFKTFPITMMMKPFARDAFGSKSRFQAINRTAQLMLTLTLMGYVAMTLKDLTRGKKPRAWEDIKESELPEADVLGKIFLSAFAQGGGAGIFGDLVWGAGQTRFGQGPLETTLGPTWPIASDIVKSTTSLARSVANGEPVGITPLRTLKNSLPYNNLWYARWLTDNMYYGMAELMRPGYINRLENAIYKENEQEFFFDPYTTSDMMSNLFR